MKAIAFHLQKGGVGKTTLSVSTAWELSELGHRTVLVDCDPQGNSSSWLLEGRAEPEYELADVLAGRVSGEDATVAVQSNLHCLPTFGLTSALRNYAKSGLASEPYVIADMVEKLPFDYAVLDMGPGLGTIEQSALIATNEVVLTMTPEYFSLDGLETWAEGVRGIERGLRAKVAYDKLVVNGLNKSIRQMVEVYEQAKKAAKKVFTIGTDPVFRKAQEAHVVAQMYKPEPMKQQTREELQRLTMDIIDGVRQ